RRAGPNFRISSLGIPERKLVRALDALVGAQSPAQICRAGGPLRVTAEPTNAMERTALAHAADKPGTDVIVALMLPSQAIVQTQCDGMGTTQQLPSVIGYPLWRTNDVLSAIASGGPMPGMVSNRESRGPRARHYSKWG